jgi:hypothetical protein
VNHPICSVPSVAHLCGWRGADHAQHLIAAKLPTLRAAAQGLFGAPEPTEPVLLYQGWWHALGRDPGYPAQAIGDCVSFGHGHANDLLQCIEISLGHMDRADYQESDTEWIYGASRKVAGILGTPDGSYGAAAIKAMMELGTVSRPMLGTDNGGYSGPRAKLWGDVGPPDAVVSQAAPYLLGLGAQVQSWAGLVAALTNGYPVTICTEQGFSLVRDAQGFCALEGTWGHCMLIAGVRFDRPGACILQSWGPDMPTGPTSLDQPSWSFWVDRPVIESILSEGDSWALSKSAGFHRRYLPASWRYGSAA